MQAAWWELVQGKTWQEIAGERLPFSDAQAARAALERRRQR